MSKKRLPEFIMFAKEGDEITLRKIEFIKEVMTSAAQHMGHKIEIGHTSVDEYIKEIQKDNSEINNKQNE